MSLQLDVEVKDDEAPDVANFKKKSVWQAIGSVFRGFFVSVGRGARIIFSSRRFIWLLPGYTLPIVIHRYLESQLCPAFAKTILGNTAYGQLMVGGSNFGELLGALFVFLFTTLVASPYLWVRFDGLSLNLLWVLPYAYPFTSNTFGYTWLLALMLVVVSSGFAAGDVSLSAFIQASLTAREEKQGKKKSTSGSALSAVMAFLYASYILIYAACSFGLGRVLDSYIKAGNPRGGFFWLAGVLMSCASLIIFASTFISKGALKFNPTFADLGVEEAEKEAEAVLLEDEKEDIAEGKYFEILGD
jgi:hypothetical protein